eukprot:2204664-Heterocapsa_arctica.AAC.1
MADLVDPTVGMTDAQLAARAMKAAAMSAIVASLAPHLRVSFWNDWRAWLRTPLKRRVLVDDRPIGGYESPLEASDTPWARHRWQ